MKHTVDIKNNQHWDLPGGPVVKNLPCNTGDMGQIPGWGAKILHGMERLETLCATMKILHDATKTCHRQINK